MTYKAPLCPRLDSLYSGYQYIRSLACQVFVMKK